MKEEPEGRVHIRIAGPADIKYVYSILKEMEASAKARGTGIAKRSPQSLCQKIYEGKAVLALAHNGDWAGFSYKPCVSGGWRGQGDQGGDLWLEPPEISPGEDLQYYDRSGGFKAES